MAPIISKVPNSRRSTVMGEGTEPNRRVQIEDDETGDIAAGSTVGIPLVSPSLNNEHIFTYIRSRDGPAKPPDPLRYARYANDITVGLTSSLISCLGRAGHHMYVNLPVASHCA
jgi:hypothetical protein